MDEKVTAIYTELASILKAHTPLLQVKKEGEKGLEVAGTKPGMQGKQKVDGYYFASIVPKPKDVRLYFFPIYTHASEFEHISPELRKCLKGKSCFHIKNLDEGLEEQIREMVQLGIDLYKNDELI